MNNKVENYENLKNDDASVRNIALVMENFARNVRKGKRGMPEEMVHYMENHFWDMI